VLSKITNSSTADQKAFRAQQRPFQPFVPAVTAKQASGRNHAMAGYAGRAAASHDVSDGSGCAWFAGCERHVAVGSDPARRNAPDDREHAVRE